MKGIVITGGLAPGRNIKVEVTSNCLICAADSGLETAIRLGLKPDLVVGDMDSLRSQWLLERFQPEAIERHPTAKDLTDTEIAIEALRYRRIDDVSIIGGGGGRLDHLIGILRLFERSFYPRVWVTDKEIVNCIDRSFVLKGCKGERVSLFPVGSDATRAETRGLRWPLDGLEWDRGDVGISNEVTKDVCRLQVDQGRLLLVRSLPPVVRVP